MLSFRLFVDGANGRKDSMRTL